MKKLQNETGRSMVEMLGVLAIIGVLSIGGIQGYTYAMNKYRANNVLNEMNIASLHLATTLLSSRNAQKMIALGEPYDSGELTSEGYPFDYGCGNYDSAERACHQEETGFWVAVGDVPEKICQQILSEAKHLPNIVEQRLNDVAVEDGSGCGENNEILLLFNSDGSGELAKDCGSGAGEEPEEPTPTVSCPENTSEDGQGGLATTLTDTATGKQIQCYCVEVDTKYTNGTCETLPETCNNNSDCNRGEYCHITEYGEDKCTRDTTGMSGTCKVPILKNPKEGTNPPFVMSNQTMWWWNARNFCQALGKTMVEVNDFQCAHTICQEGCYSKQGYCHADTTIGTSVKDENNISVNVEAMKLAYGNYYGWTNTDYEECKPLRVFFRDGGAHHGNNRLHLDYHVVCK